MSKVEQYITSIPDFPKEGIIFRDITTVLGDADGFHLAVDEMTALLDGVESFNVHPGHNSRVAVAAKYAHEHHLIETCGTDYHHPGHQGLGLTLTKTLPSDTFELAALLHSGDFLFEIGGDVVIPARLHA